MTTRALAAPAARAVRDGAHPLWSPVRLLFILSSALGFRFGARG
jgi:hypothetical protein